MERAKKFLNLNGRDTKTMKILLIVLIFSLIVGVGIHKEYKNQNMAKRDVSPAGYTWEQYQEMTSEEKLAFQKSFGDMDEYKKWYEDQQASNEDENVLLRLDLNERNPEDYTWEEYQELTPEEKAVFPDCFKDMNAYNEWYDKNKEDNEDKEEFESDEAEDSSVSIDLNGKNPKDYTWEEYQKLAPEEKAVFPDCFKDMNAYNEWYEKNKEETVGEDFSVSIDLNGRNPEDYTWEQYQALTQDEKAIFPDYFENMEAYKTWYERVCINK